MSPQHTNNNFSSSSKITFTIPQILIILSIIASLIWGLCNYVITEKDQDLHKLISSQGNDHELLLETRDEVHELKTLITFRLDRLEKKVDR